PLLGVGLHEDRVLAAPLDRGADALEVVALRDLLGGLVDGVVHLLAVDLAHDVEGRVGCHRWGLLGCEVDHAGRWSGAPAPAWYCSARSCTDLCVLTERLKVADCKSAAECFADSNPAPAT